MTRFRPEQLNLQADPTFNIDLDLGFDLSSFDLGSSPEPSSLLSPRTLPSSQTGSLDDEAFLTLAAPLDQSSSHGVGAGDGFDFVYDHADVVFQDDDQTNGVQPAAAATDEEGWSFVNEGADEENVLEIREDGELIVHDRSMRDTSMSDPIVANDDFPAIEVHDQDFELVTDGNKAVVVSERSCCPSID